MLANEHDEEKNIDQGGTCVVIIYNARANKRQVDSKKISICVLLAISILIETNYVVYYIL